MSKNNFTCWTQKQSGHALVAFVAFNPEHLIWIEFDQPIRRLKASPAIECVFRSIANQLEQSDGTRLNGLAIAHADFDGDNFPSQHRFPLFISWTGRGPSLPLLQEKVRRVVDGLRSCDDSTIFQSMRCVIDETAEALANVFELHDWDVPAEHREVAA